MDAFISQQAAVPSDDPEKLGEVVSPWFNTNCDGLLGRPDLIDFVWEHR